ncbi:MAG: hypothetical protein NTZ97_02100, partial [Candidatus Moranbacteria bacterium]|nr:hypothetical protein [Candidatus Moranbacteria bacterium]
HVLEYDDVMNKQREVIYKKRREILKKSDIKNEVLEYIAEEIERLISFQMAEDENTWNIKEICQKFKVLVECSEDTERKLEEIKNDKRKNTSEKISAMAEFLIGMAKEAYNKKEQQAGSEQMRSVERAIVLQTIDLTWMNHLDEIDYLRESVGIRGYGQRDPLIEYKREAFNMFTSMMEQIRSTVVNTVFRIQVMSEPGQPVERPRQDLQFKGASDEIDQFGAAKKVNDGETEEVKQSPIINKDKVGRNDPCPCGARHADGRPKKYKHCCGK